MMMFVAGCARAGDPWTQADWNRQFAYTVLDLADWAQTRYIATRPQFHETNRFLGEHPSLGKVNNYFAATLAAHWLITDLLPSRYRPVWQYGTITFEAYFVLHNRSLGVGFKF